MRRNVICCALLVLFGTVLAAGCVQPTEPTADAPEPDLVDEPSPSANDPDALASDESLPESCAKACYAGPSELAAFCRALVYYPDRAVAERCKGYINGSKVKCIAWCAWEFAV